MSLAAILLPIATEIGAPIIKKLLEKKIGGKGGAIAGKVIDQIAEKVGAGKSPEQVERAVKAEPQIVREIIREVERNTSKEMIAALQGHKGYLDLLSQDAKSNSAFISGWRPAVGYVFAFSMAVQVLMIAFAVLTNNPAILKALAEHSATIIAMNTVHAAVTGAYVWRRSDEKIEGKA